MTVENKVTITGAKEYERILPGLVYWIADQQVPAGANIPCAMITLAHR